MTKFRSRFTALAPFPDKAQVGGGNPAKQPFTPPESAQPQKNKHSKEDSSDKADEATDKADESGLRADHVSAAMAHEVAANIAQAHGDDARMERHDAAAAMHYKRASGAARDPIATTHYKAAESYLGILGGPGSGPQGGGSSKAEQRIAKEGQIRAHDLASSAHTNAWHDHMAASRAQARIGPDEDSKSYDAKNAAAKSATDTARNSSLLAKAASDHAGGTIAGSHAADAASHSQEAQASQSMEMHRGANGDKGARENHSDAAKSHGSAAAAHAEMAANLRHQLR